MSCDKLPLINFISCLVEKDLKQLIIFGNPPEEVLLEQWNIIYSEYAKLIGDENIVVLLHHISEINAINSRISRVRGLVYMLGKMYNPELAALLKEQGFDLPFEDNEDLNSLLDRVMTLLKREERERDELQKTINEMQKTDTEEDSITSVYFDETLLTYSEVFSYSTQKENLTTQQFCLMVKRLKNKIKNETVNTDYAG